MAAYDFPDTAGKPTDGSFEYTAPDGTLYEWNGYAWVVPTGDNTGGGGGDAARVLTQALPPSPAEDGDMFWCTDDGRLYLYYDDADTKQWVDASPDNKAGGGSDDDTPGVRYQEGTWTPTLNNGTATSSNLIWSRSGNTVTIQGQLQDFSDITTNSTLSVAGMPYAIDSYQAYGFCASNRTYTTTSNNPINMCYISPANEMRFYGGSKDTTVGGTTLDSSGLTATSVLHFSISYLTDDDTFVPGTGATVTEDIQGTGGGSGGGGEGGTTINYNGASAWGNIASDGEALGSFNVASVTKSGTGQYKVIFTTPMPTANYSVVASTATNGFYQVASSGNTINGFDINVRRTDIVADEDAAFAFVVHSANAIAPQSGVGADAWASCTNDGTITGSSNIFEVVRTDVGSYTATFVTPMPNPYYSVSLSSSAFTSIVNAGRSTTSFTYSTRDKNGDLESAESSFVVHASSTVTPTYTWTRNGTTLEPANAGDSVAVAGKIEADGLIKSQGAFYSQRPLGTDSCFRAEIQGNDTPNAFIYADGSASFNELVKIDGTLRANRTQGNQSCIEALQNNVANAVITADGTISGKNVTFNLEPDDPANFSTEGEYTGPTLDVKDRVLNLISRLDAIEANEIIDDATDTSLLQLLANASSRLDSIESRLTALEGGSN